MSSAYFGVSKHQKVMSWSALKQTNVTRPANITKSDKFSSIKDLMIQKDGKLFAAENVFGTVVVGRGNYLQSENFLSHF